MRASKILGILSALIPFSIANIHGHHWGRRHQEVAVRARGDVAVHKRDTFDNARFTFYDVGLGACGKNNVPSDFIVALNVDQYGDGYPGPMCFLSITISYGGKTAQATIMDECMGCPYGGLDFSTGLFDYFASESEGVLYGTWWFNDGSSDPTTSTTSTWSDTTTSTPWTPEPTSTTWSSTTTWTPTPTYTPTTTSSSSSPAYTPSSTTPPTTAQSSTTPSATPSSFSSSSSSINYSSGVASGIAIPTGTVVAAPNSPQNLLAINEAVINLGIIVAAGGQGI